MEVDEDRKRDALMRATVLIEDAGAELSRSAFALMFSGAEAERIPTIDEAEAERRAGAARGWCARSDAIARPLLPPALAVTLDILDATADRIAREADWYWLVYDPSGYGFFNLFGPTGYGEATRLNQTGAILKRHRFRSGGDGHRYLALLADIAALARGMRTRLEGQAARGIRMPRAQVEQALPLIAALRQRLAANYLPSADRLAALPDPAGFLAQARALIDGEMDQAFASVADWIETERDRAPEGVGMAQYPGGADVYAGLVRLHTTQPLSPDQVHRIGLERLAAIEADMAEVCREIGFAGGPLAYRDALRDDPACRAKNGRAVQAAFDRAMAAAEPWMDRWFHRPPPSPYGTAQLPEALAASVAFGFYKPPAGPGDRGVYSFNARNLVRQGTAMVPTLTYHELVPGHHIHLGNQPHDPALPAALRFGAFNAFAEGWAEYAATLAGECGLYATPADRFGRLMMDAFLTTRLVVDTGMNALGWSLERARDFMSQHAFMTESEVRTESIRYSCDMPGQSLAYKLGDTFLLEQRERMRAALGDRFDLRDFHALVLRESGMPLPLLAREVDRTLAAG